MKNGNQMNFYEDISRKSIINTFGYVSTLRSFRATKRPNRGNGMPQVMFDQFSIKYKGIPNPNSRMGQIPKTRIPTTGNNIFCNGQDG